jgi:uncharacterized Zn finger protein
MEEQEKITVLNFRNELDESVIARGWMYFSNGWVKKPREIMPGYFEAVVEEVNPHAVSFSYNPEDESFTDFFCTCGEKKHSVCRHAAAVICYYEKEYQLLNKPLTWDELELVKAIKRNDRKN